MARTHSRPAKQPADRSVVVVLHRIGEQWNALTARIESTAGATGGPIRILKSRSIPRADRTGLARWVESESPGRILIVVPASRVICRSFSLPDATPDRLQAALQLQAEAHLLGAVPPHRLGLSVLPADAAGSGAERSRTGLLVGWPLTGSDPELEQPVTPPPGVECSHIADVSALAGLLGRSRPAEPLLWLDRPAGAVAIAVPYSGGIVLRATREQFSSSAGSDQPWLCDVVRAVGETLLSVGIPVPEARAVAERTEARLRSMSTDSSDSYLVLPESVKEVVARQIGGEPGSPAWWSSHGIAAGAVLCLTNGLEALTRMKAEEVEVRPPLTVRAAEALSRPRTAAALVAMALLLLAFGPLVLAGSRKALLQTKVSDLEALRLQNLEDEKQRTMYRELGRQTWPMSKLLADISNSAPRGVRIASVVIDRGSGVVVEGTSNAQGGMTAVDNLVEMARTMAATGVFTQVRFDRTPGAEPANANFRLSAVVTDPFRTHEWAPEKDFNVTSLAMMMYGGKETTPGVDPSPGPVARGSAGGGQGRNTAGSTDPNQESDSASDSALAGVGTPSEREASEQSTTEQAGGSARASARTDLAMGPSRRRATNGPAEAQPSEIDPSDPEYNPPSPDSSTEGAADGAAEREDRSERSRGDRRAITRRGDSDSAGRAGGAASRGDVAAGGSWVDVPPPLSDEAIAGMTRDEAQQALSRISKARLSQELEDDVKARLKNEFDKVMAHMRSLK